jgi:hypothetical protein
MYIYIYFNTWTEYNNDLNYNKKISKIESI